MDMVHSLHIVTAVSEMDLRFTRRIYCVQATDSIYVRRNVLRGVRAAGLDASFVALLVGTCLLLKVHRSENIHLTEIPNTAWSVSKCTS